MMQEAIAADAPIVCAWERRRILIPQLNRLYRANPPRLMHENLPAEATEDAISAVDEVIRGTVSRSLKGLTAQIWVALYYTADFISDEHETAMLQGDLATVERFDERMDFNVRLLVAALRSINAMEVGHA